MDASILIRPVSQARAMFIGCSARATTSSLLAVSRMSAGGSPGAASRTGASPDPRALTNVRPRSGMVTLIVRFPKYWSRSAGLSSESRPASFCSAVRHSSAEVMCASLLVGRYRSRGRVAYPASSQVAKGTAGGRKYEMDSERVRPALAPTGDPRVDAAIGGLASLEDVDLAERPAVLEAVHDRLREILGELGDPGEPGRRGEQGELGGAGQP